MPLLTSIIASVTMNGGIPHRVIISPVNAPTRPQAAMAATQASSMPPVEASGPPR